MELPNPTHIRTFKTISKFTATTGLYYRFLYRKKLWSAPLDIFSFFGNNEALAREWMIKPFQLLEVKKIPDQTIRERKLWGLVEFTLKHRQHLDFRQLLKILLPWIQEVEQNYLSGYALTKSVLKYTLDGIETKDVDVLEKEMQFYLNTKLGEEIMTFEQACIERGREKGIQQGLAQGEAAVLLRLLKRRFPQLPETYVEKIQQADAETLLLLSERILDAKVLDEIFV